MIDNDIVQNVGSLLDRRETVQATFEATYVSMSKRGNPEPRDVEVVVTDNRLMAFRQDAEGNRKLFSIAPRSRLLDAQPTDSGLKSSNLMKNLFFKPEAKAAIDEVNEFASTWDEIEHDRLGLLVKSRTHRYEHNFTSGGEKFSLEIDLGFSHEFPEDIFAFAADIVDDFESICEAVTNRVVAQMLPLKNECWLNDGEEPLTQAEFLDNLSLNTSIFIGSLRANFSFDDGRMFGRHSIRTSYSHDKTIGKPEI